MVSPARSPQDTSGKSILCLLENECLRTACQEASGRQLRPSAGHRQGPRFRKQRVVSATPPLRLPR